MIRCVDKACKDGPPEDDEPRPRYALEGCLLCRRCSDRLEQRLAEAPSRAEQLREVLGGMQSPAKDGSRHTKGSPPIPLNLPAHDLLEELRTTLGSWMRLVAEERDLRGPDRDTVQAHSSWLLAQLDYLVEQPWVDDLADEVRDLSRSADGLTRAQLQWHRLPAPCPNPDCEQLTLGRWDGEDHVGCKTCGELWPESDYRRLVAVLASISPAILDARAAAHLAEVDVATIRQWVKRGRLKRLPGEGPATYAARDVEALRKDGVA